MRLRLKLTQEEAGRVLGGGKRAFQKYETGKISPSDAAVALLEMMERHPEDLELFKSIPGGQWSKPPPRERTREAADGVGNPQKGAIAFSSQMGQPKYKSLKTKVYI